MAFDPYLIWLDISPHERPVNYYRLFGLRPLESDPAMIAAAAQRVITHVSQFQNSPNAAVCQQLLAELNVAQACLLDPLRKAAYDRGFSAPAGGERTINAPPMPGAPQQQRPASVPYVAPNPQSTTPAWMTNPPAGRPQQRGGERQISASPPLPSMGSPTKPTTSYSPASYAPAPYVPTPTAPLPTPAPALPKPVSAPLQPSHPSGAIPFGSSPATGASKPGAAQFGAAPSGPASGSYVPQPYVPAYSPAPQPTPPAPSYAPTPMPTPPSPVAAPGAAPAWAAAERTGQVGTVVAGEAMPTQTLTEPPRRIVRRQSNNTMVYVVVAIAMAMIVFFFGAVLLLALFMAAR